jgi:hypothetical protein
MVTEYATPRSIPFLESIPRVLTSGFLAIDHCYGTVLPPRFTESKKVNLYRIYSICVMLCVCGVRCARCVRYVVYFFV